MALDLAGGFIMARTLSNMPEFAVGTTCKVEYRDDLRMPSKFPGASSFDFAVLDSDDSYTVPEDLLNGSKAGWRVISPVNPFDTVGLDRVPRELRAVAIGGSFVAAELRISVFTNLAYGGDPQVGHGRMQSTLASEGIGSLLLRTILPHSSSVSKPVMLDDQVYSDALSALLREVGI